MNIEHLLHQKTERGSEILKEYHDTFYSLEQKINALEPTLAETIKSIAPKQETFDSYFAHPIEELKVFVEKVVFTPQTVVDIAALRRVLWVKLENVQNEE